MITAFSWVSIRVTLCGQAVRCTVAGGALVQYAGVEGLRGEAKGLTRYSGDDRYRYKI